MHDFGADGALRWSFLLIAQSLYKQNWKVEHRKLDVEI